MGGTVPIVVGILLPIFSVAIFNLGGVVFVIYVLGKVGYNNLKSHPSMDVRRKTLFQDIRVVLGVFLSGLSWIFGAVSILETFRWSDYMSILCEICQMFFLCVTYIFTKNIALLYRNLLCCKNS